MEKLPVRSCLTPARGPIAVPAGGPTSSAPSSTNEKKEESAMAILVGRPAPGFEANAFVDRTFGVVKLSDYAGKWVVLCFYPGDFTFV